MITSCSVSSSITVLALYFQLYGSTPVLMQWHIKDSSHSAESVRGRLHLGVHTPLTQPSLSRLTLLSGHRVKTFQGNKFICNLSGNACPELSQFAEPPCTDPGVKGGTGARQLISTFKKLLEGELIGNLPQNSCM